MIAFALTGILFALLALDHRNIYFSVAQSCDTSFVCRILQKSIPTTYFSVSISFESEIAMT